MGKTLCVISLIVANPSTDHCNDEAAWKIWDRRRHWRDPPSSHKWTILAQPNTKSSFMDDFEIGEVLYTDPNRYSYLGADEFKVRKEDNEEYASYKAKPPPAMPSQYTNAQGYIKVKTTLIFTSISLFGQWEDEIKKFAPSFVVRRYECSHNPHAKHASTSHGYFLTVVLFFILLESMADATAVGMEQAKRS